jgi:hypothetical protein
MARLPGRNAFCESKDSEARAYRREFHIAIALDAFRRALFVSLNQLENATYRQLVKPKS